MNGVNCQLNFSHHTKNINKISRSLRNILNNIASSKTSIEQVNKESKNNDKFKVKDIPQIENDKKIVNQKFKINDSGSGKDSAQFVLFDKFSGENSRVTRNVSELKNQIKFINEKYYDKYED